jgi:hypothetical protein
LNINYEDEWGGEQRRRSGAFPVQHWERSKPETGSLRSPILLASEKGDKDRTVGVGDEIYRI